MDIVMGFVAIYFECVVNILWIYKRFAQYFMSL